MGNFNLQINGVKVNTPASGLIKLDKGVNQEQAMDAAKGNALDEIMVYDQESGEAYMAYGEGMNFGGLDGYQAGDKVHATLNGKQVAIVPFVANVNNQAVQMIFDDELNSAKEGALTALTVGKNVGLKVLGMVKDNALETFSGVSTASYLAVAGGATRAAAGKTIGQKVFNFMMPAQAGQELIKAAGKGGAKYGKTIAIAGGVAAVAGVVGTAIYGGNRSTNATAIEQLGTKVK